MRSMHGVPCAFTHSHLCNWASQRPMADPAKRTDDYLGICCTLASPRLLPGMDLEQDGGRRRDAWFRLNTHSVTKWRKQTSRSWRRWWIRRRWLELSRVYLYSWLRLSDALIIQSFPIWGLFTSFRMMLIPLPGSWNKGSPLHKKWPLWLSVAERLKRGVRPF